MLSFYLIWTLIYAVLLLYLGQHWRSLKNRKIGSHFFPEVTLLIPFRNEMDGLPGLLAQLSQLNYPNLQILLINDHSEDGSEKWAQNNQSKFPNVQLLHSRGVGKKAAIEYGVSRARGEIILTSDADCTFTKDWIYQMIQPFTDPDIQLVAGPVLVGDQISFLSNFQQIDWASILLISNYFFQKQNPLMCSAANLAYRKSAFLSVDGYVGNHQYSSGDDEFLLKKIANFYGGESCCYLTDKESLVVTKSEKSWGALVNQRIRWAGKWRAHRSFLHMGSAIGSISASLVWICIYGLIAFGTQGVLVILSCLSVKYLIEFLVLGKVLKSFNKQYTFITFMCASFIHPLYVMRIGLGAIQGKFIWKGRVNSGSVNLEIDN